MNRLNKTIIGLCFFTVCGFLFAQSFPAIYDATIDKSKMNFVRVAIIPNRLPLTIAEPEYWRELNWRTFSDKFKQKGFTVIDYKTTLDAFTKSNLPLEDTKSSEEKFAAFAQQVNADLVVMPYYSASSNTRTGCLGISNVNFTSTSSIQAYSLEHNKFIYRSDASGSNGYKTGYLMLGGTALSLCSMLFTDVPEVAMAFSITGIVCVIVGSVQDLINSSKPAENRWKSAFEEAIDKNIEPLIATSKPIKTQPKDEGVTKFCTGCGAKIPASVKFCPQCGANQGGQ